MPTQTLFGTQVFLTPDQPRMQLSNDVPVSDACREEMNAWLLGFFGTNNLLQDGEVVQVSWPHPALHMNQRTWAQINEAAAHRAKKES